jgi:hypothetical protein
MEPLRGAPSRASLDGSYHRGTPRTQINQSTKMRKIQLALLRKVQSALTGAAAFARPNHEGAGKLRNPGGLANVREPPSILEDPNMADDLKDRGARDRSRMNVHEENEVRYWTEKWGVAKDQLVEAVERAGVSVQAVARELGKSHP